MSAPDHTTPTKICTKCHQDKPLDSFRAYADRPGKRHAQCRACEGLRVRRTLSPTERSRARHRANERAMWERRGTYKRPGPTDPDRDRARRKLRDAVAAGKVVKPRCCQECGVSGRIEGHHADYARPFDVEWLCPLCHGRRHRKEVAA